MVSVTPAVIVDEIILPSVIIELLVVLPKVINDELAKKVAASGSSLPSSSNNDATLNPSPSTNVCKIEPLLLKRVPSESMNILLAP